MVEIIRLHGDPHAQTQQLLPWYVAGALKTRERTEVEAHLSECVECREDLEMEQALARGVRGSPLDADRGWATLKARIDGSRPRRRSAWSRLLQAAGFALPGLRPTRSPPRPPRAAAGNLIVVFAPGTSEASLRAILKQTQARIVDGPTSTDAYLLHVADDQRAEALAWLKADRNIWSVEPID